MKELVHTESAMRAALQENDVKQRGYRASPKFVHRYEPNIRVYAVHTRFGKLAWFVEDTNELDECGLPRVIRQEDTFEEAIFNLGFPV